MNFSLTLGLGLIHVWKTGPSRSNYVKCLISNKISVPLALLPPPGANRHRAGQLSARGQKEPRVQETVQAPGRCSFRLSFLAPTEPISILTTVHSDWRELAPCL